MQSNKEVVINTKYLHFLSKVTLYGTPICIILFLSLSIPTICPYTIPMGPMLYVFPKIFLTFYQIGRLYLCFSESKVHSKYGYSKHLFFFLYITGIILILYVVIYPWIFNVSAYEPSDNLGCTAIPPQSTIYQYNSLFAMGLYTFWDLWVLSLYIFKLIQATQRLKTNNIYQHKQVTQMRILKRVKLILSKISFLTIIFEIVSNGTIHLFLWFDHPIKSIIGQSVWSIDFVVTMYTMYLMLEHNNNDYIKLLMFLKRIWIMKVCCCCFNNLFYDNDAVDIDTVQNEERVPDVTGCSKYDTTTLGQLPSIKRNVTINKSEDTEIEIDAY